MSVIRTRLATALLGELATVVIAATLALLALQLRTDVPALSVLVPSFAVAWLVWLAFSVCLLGLDGCSPGMAMAGLRFEEPPAPGRLLLVIALQLLCLASLGLVLLLPGHAVLWRLAAGGPELELR